MTSAHDSCSSIGAASLLAAALLAGTIHSAHAQVQPDTFGTPEADYAEALAVSGSAVYVGGATSGSLDGINQGGQDAFLRKYNEHGKVLWRRQFGTSADDVITGVAHVASGSTYASGFTLGSLAGSWGNADAFLRKYTWNGEVAWTHQFGTPAKDVATAVSVDGNANIYVAGFTFGHMQGEDLRGSDAFVRKYAPNGAVIWTRQFGTSGSDHVQAVAADAEGNVVVVGYVNGDLEGASKGSADAYIRKYDTKGNVQWTKQFGTSGYDAAFDVALDSTGAAVVTGWTTGSLRGFTNAGGKDVFAHKFGSDGTVLRRSQFGTPGDDIAIGVATDPAGNFYVTGRTTGAFRGANAGHFDVFVRKYTSTNSTPGAWLRQFGTSGYEGTYAVGAPTPSKIYVAGETRGALGASNRGQTDAFVRRLDQYGNTVWTVQ